MISIAVVEDDPGIRDAVGECLAGAGDCRLLGMFADGASAIAGIPPLTPDVVLMDINLPDCSGVECVARIAPLLPRSEIIMLTVFQDAQTIFRALSAGAHGYLVKPVMPRRLLAAIREIRNGGVPMSPSIAREVIDHFRRRSVTAKTQPSDDPQVELTEENAGGLGPRERQVVEYLRRGMSYKEIAAELGISLWTVATYVRRIYDKLHVSSRREIIARFSDPGLPQP